MGLDAVVRSAVATAKSVTSDLQDDVTHEAWTGDGAYGAPTYAAGVSRPALVERKHELVRKGMEQSSSGAGEIRKTQTKITFLTPITANGASGRTEPIDPRDKITLADGTTGPILKTAGLIDPSTGLPYMMEVWLG